MERTSGKLNWGFDKVFDLNVKGLFYMSRECIPLLRKDGLHGTFEPSAKDNNNSIEDPGMYVCLFVCMYSCLYAFLISYNYAYDSK